MSTRERCRSPSSLQRSQAVFSPTSRMTNSPTNFTPRAPDRFTPVSTSHSHQGVLKGLHNDSSSVACTDNRLHHLHYIYGILAVTIQSHSGNLTNSLEAGLEQHVSTSEAAAEETPHLHLCVLNLTMLSTAPRIKNMRMGSRRMY